jgi:hypothetical protein
MSSQQRSTPQDGAKLNGVPWWPRGLRDSCARPPFWQVLMDLKLGPGQGQWLPWRVHGGLVLITAACLTLTTYFLARGVELARMTFGLRVPGRAAAPLPTTLKACEGQFKSSLLAGGGDPRHSAAVVASTPASARVSCQAQAHDAKTAADQRLPEARVVTDAIRGPRNRRAARLTSFRNRKRAQSPSSGASGCSPNSTGTFVRCESARAGGSESRARNASG